MSGIVAFVCRVVQERLRLPIIPKYRNNLCLRHLRFFE